MQCQSTKNVSTVNYEHFQIENIVFNFFSFDINSTDILKTCAGVQLF